MRRQPITWRQRPWPAASDVSHGAYAVSASLVLLVAVP